jgi:hypothetical protein
MNARRENSKRALDDQIAGRRNSATHAAVQVLVDLLAAGKIERDEHEVINADPGRLPASFHALQTREESLADWQ